MTNLEAKVFNDNARYALMLAAAKAFCERYHEQELE
jgi:hypothetical protein